jgi:hypothetical protein
VPHVLPPPPSTSPSEPKANPPCAPPHAPRRLAGNRLAIAFWQQLRGRSETDRRFVLAGLETARRAGRAEDRKAKAEAEKADLDAVWTVFFAFASDPSITSTSAKSYRRWHALQPDKEDLPSEATLRRLLGDGSWSRLLENANMRYRADATVRRLTALGPFFTREEILAAIQAWLGGLSGEARLSDFLADCQTQLEALGHEAPRLPRSESPIRRLGGWQHLLDGADPDGALRQQSRQRADSADETGAPPRRKRTTHSRSRSTCPSTHGGRKPYTRAEAKDFLTRAQAEEAVWLTKAAYNALAREWRTQLMAAGKPPRVASAYLICKVLKMPWLEALAWSAGDEAGVPARFGQGRKHSDEFIEAAASAAMDELGENLGLEAYEQRRLRLKASGIGDIPSERNVRDRLGSGSWPVAMQRVRRLRAGARSARAAKAAR